MKNKLFFVVVASIMVLILCSGAYALCDEKDYSCQFNLAPTSDNFNKLSYPTADHFERLANPTISDFGKLDSIQQKDYLTRNVEKNYRTDFAEHYLVNEKDGTFSASFDEEEKSLARKFFGEDIGHVNKHRHIFKNFLEKEYPFGSSKLMSVEATFTNYDPETGEAETIGEKGSKFNFKELKSISKNYRGSSEFHILKDGSLVLKSLRKLGIGTTSGPPSIDHYDIRFSGDIHTIDGQTKVTGIIDFGGLGGRYPYSFGERRSFKVTDANFNIKDYTITSGSAELLGVKYDIPSNCETCLIRIRNPYDGYVYDIEGENFKLPNGDELKKGGATYTNTILSGIWGDSQYYINGLGTITTISSTTSTSTGGFSVSHYDYLNNKEHSSLNLDRAAGVINIDVRWKKVSLDLDENPTYNLIVPINTWSDLANDGGEITITQGEKIIKGKGTKVLDNNQHFNGVDVTFVNRKRFYTVSEQGSGLCTGYSVESPECNLFVKSYYAPEIELIKEEGDLEIVGKDIKKYAPYLSKIRYELELLMNQEEEKVEGKYKRAIKKIVFVDDENFAKECGVSPASYDGCAGGGIIYLKESGLNDGTFTHEAAHLWRFAPGNNRILKDIKMPSRNAIGKSVVEMHCLKSGVCLRVYEKKGKYYTKFKRGDEVYESVLGNKGELALTHVWEDSLVTTGSVGVRDIYGHDGDFSKSVRGTYFKDDEYNDDFPEGKVNLLRKMYYESKIAPEYGYKIDPNLLATTIKETGIPTAYGSKNSEEAVAELVKYVRTTPYKLEPYLKKDSTYFSPKLVDNIMSLHKRGAITKQERDWVLAPYKESIGE